MLPSLFRLRTVDEQFLRHSEWVRRLGAPTVIGLAGIFSIPLSIFVLLPHSLTTVAGPSTLIALILAFVIMMFAGRHISELSCSMPKNCVLYNFTFAALGELPAFIVGWTSLLESVSISSLLCKAWSQHVNIMTGGKIGPLTKISLTNDGFLRENEYDITALTSILIAISILCCSLRVVGTVSIILLIVASLVVTSCSFVGFFHSDPQNWVDAPFFTFGFDGVLRSCALLICGFAGVDSISYLLEETSHPRKKMPVVVPLLTTIFSLFIFIVSMVFSLSVNVSNLPDEIAIPELFTIINVPSAKYMLTISSVCGLSGAVLVSFLPGSRLVAALAQDRLLPIPRDSSTKTPLIAVLVFSVLTAFGIVIKRAILLEIISFLAPLKLLLTVCLTHMQHYRSQPIGLCQEANHYRKVKNRRHSYLSYALDGSGTVSISRDHSLSSMSEAVALQMHVAQQEAHKHQKRLEKKLDENTQLIMERSPIPRSVSMYNSVGNTKRSTSISSFAAVNQGHNCIAEPCSPTHTLSQKVHLFNQEQPDVPYVNHYNAKDRPTSPADYEDNFTKSNWLLAIFIVISLLTSSLIPLGFQSISSGVLLCLLVTLLFFTLYMVTQLTTNDGISRRQSRVHLFPYISYFTIFLLILLLSASKIGTLGKVLVWQIAGILLYLSYGYRHSIERRSHASLIIQNPTAQDIDDEEVCRGIVDDENSTSEDF